MTQRVVRRGRMLAAIVSALTLAAQPAPARDLGVRGTVWAVVEPDLLTEIEARLGAMEASGDLARMRDGALERARQRIEAPGRGEGIEPARVRRTRLFDPSVTVERDIRAADGTLIAARGTRINPLDVHPLTRDLLFIDGGRPVEVAWALRPRAARPRSCSWRAVLWTSCGPTAVRSSSTRAAGSRNVLDFALTPSVVAAEGSVLRITEVPLEDEAESTTDGGRP